MSLIKCEKCSEMYSDSYKRCPFCAEDEEFYGGKVKKRAHRKQETRHKTPSILGPIMVLVVLLIAFLVWLLALGGTQTLSRIFGGDTTPVVEEQQPDQEQPDDAEPATQLEMDPVVLNLGVNESAQLTCTGGEGIKWASSDPAVVTVTADGAVTSHEEGTAIITATDSQGSTAVCSVTVSAEQQAQTPTDTTTPSDNTTPNTPSSGTKLDLSKVEIKVPIYGTTLPKADGRFDTSMRVGENYQLEVGGVSGTVSWSSGNSNIASIAADGTLKAVGKGETTVTGTVGGGSFDILVRVS